MNEYLTITNIKLFWTIITTTIIITITATIQWVNLINKVDTIVDQHIEFRKEFKAYRMDSEKRLDNLDLTVYGNIGGGARLK